MPVSYRFLDPVTLTALTLTLGFPSMPIQNIFPILFSFLFHECVVSLLSVGEVGGRSIETSFSC